MPTKHSLSVLQLLELGQNIRDLPPVEYDPWNSKRPPTRLETVGMLKDDITAMREKGYSVAQIAEYLTANGLTISANGLYDAMRRLKCSLTRKPVPLAQLLLDRLAAPGAAPVSEAVDAVPVAQSKRKAHCPPRCESVSRTDPALQRVDRIAILPRAQRLLKKLKASEAVVFKEALHQLEHGKQFIELDPETVDAGQLLTALGLLRPVKEQGSYAFEVPYEMAHIQGERKSGNIS